MTSALSAPRSPRSSASTGGSLRLERSLHTRATIVWYARRCGWVFPGETAIVVQGIGGSDCG